MDKDHLPTVQIGNMSTHEPLELRESDSDSNGIELAFAAHRNRVPVGGAPDGTPALAPM